MKKEKGFAQILIFLIIIVGLAATIFLVKSKAPQIFKSRADYKTVPGNFQPTAPYYSTFFYPWFATPSLGGDWGHWKGDRGEYQPPKNWFSNYLPDYNPSKFDPSEELYSTWDEKVFYWQLKKMAEANIEVAISSWWGQKDTGDNEFKHIITNSMNKADNPYPNLRWAVLYEDEGFDDPSVEQIVNDLTYIKNNFANQPTYLKIDGKPVVFVYGEEAPTDGQETTDRWAEARKQTGFYVVTKVYTDYILQADKLDSWYQYATALYEEQQNHFSYFVSPGFYLGGTSSPRLPRDLSIFRNSVKNLVNAKVDWKLIETWNEWGEGTGIEPADQVIQTTSGTAVLDPKGVPFKNAYIDILHELLPPLENGTGANKPTEKPSPIIINGSGFIFVDDKKSYATGEEVKIKLKAKAEESSNLFIAKLNFPPDLLQVKSVDLKEGTTFVKNWVEDFYDNTQGLISLTGGIPNPGYQSVEKEGDLMAEITFIPLKTGIAKISLGKESAIYRNSDNINILSSKGELEININSGTPATSSPTVIPTNKPIASPSTSSSLNADINSDKAINLKDLSYLFTHWGESNIGKADLNDDKKVNVYDYSILLKLLRSSGVIK